MKKYILVLSVISLFLLVACSKQQAIDEKQVVGQGTPVRPADTNAQEDVVGDSGISMKVPAPGNEDVKEMVVNDGSGEDSTNAGVVEFNMIAKQWEFDPETITVNQGNKVILHIKSVDVTHGFALPDFNVNANLAPGKTVDVEFTADKKGTFTFQCSVFCGSGHREMKGKLVVE